MDQPVVSSVSLGMALTRLIEVAYGAAPPSIRVTVLPASEEPMYAALLPLESRADVHHYIAEHTDVAMPLDGWTLVLSGRQALKVINLAYRQEPKTVVS
jgi:hypothetical protein